MFQHLVIGRLAGLGIQVQAERERLRLTFNTGERFDLEVHDQGFWRDWVLRGSLGLGETYVDGKWDIANDQLQPLIRAFMTCGAAELRPLEKLYHRTARALGVGHDKNDPSGSHRASSHHYDRGNDLFKSFLDEDMVYSCAFFDDPDWDLEMAQRHKIDVTLNRLDVFEGARVLDMGCGWGSLAIEAAQRGAEVTGFALAEQQIALARERTAERGMKIQFEVADYRTFADAHLGMFDRIVSVGLMEAVGRRQYKTFFGTISKLLEPSGKAVVHSIVDWPFGPIIPWLERYIFPGGEVPQVNDMICEAEQMGLRVESGPYHHDGFNYAKTLAHWRERFLTKYPGLDHEKYPERFKRLWLFYLASCEAAFLGTSLHNAQVVYRR